MTDDDLDGQEPPAFGACDHAETQAIGNVVVCLRCGRTTAAPEPEPANLLDRALRGQGDAWDRIGRRHGG